MAIEPPPWSIRSRTREPRGPWAHQRLRPRDLENIAEEATERRQQRDASLLARCHATLEAEVASAIARSQRSAPMASLAAAIDSPPAFARTPQGLAASDDDRFDDGFSFGGYFARSHTSAGAAAPPHREPTAGLQAPASRATPAAPPSAQAVPPAAAPSAAAVDGQPQASGAPQGAPADINIGANDDAAADDWYRRTSRFLFRRVAVPIIVAVELITALFAAAFGIARATIDLFAGLAVGLGRAFARLGRIGRRQGAGVPPPAPAQPRAAPLASQGVPPAMSAPSEPGLVGAALSAEAVKPSPAKPTGPKAAADRDSPAEAGLTGPAASNSDDGEETAQAGPANPASAPGSDGGGSENGDGDGDSNGDREAISPPASPLRVPTSASASEATESRPASPASAPDLSLAQDLAELVSDTESAASV